MFCLASSRGSGDPRPLMLWRPLGDVSAETELRWSGGSLRGSCIQRRRRPTRRRASKASGSGGSSGCSGVEVSGEASSLVSLREWPQEMDIENDQRPGPSWKKGFVLGVGWADRCSPGALIGSVQNRRTLVCEFRSCAWRSTVEVG